MLAYDRWFTRVLVFEDSRDQLPVEIQGAWALVYL